ncbi:hypothetical protein MMC21_003711 [Puttea exsequens]|nr:hypothetical protein [Puttea exsequens]
MAIARLPLILLHYLRSTLQPTRMTPASAKAFANAQTGNVASATRPNQRPLRASLPTIGKPDKQLAGSFLNSRRSLGLSLVGSSTKDVKL